MTWIADGDGFTDSLDAFPTDSTQDEDEDGDGMETIHKEIIQMNSLRMIHNGMDTDGDGYGDNPDGNDSDAFPTNSEQWIDSDGDGYGDNMNKQGGDRFLQRPHTMVRF